MARELARYVSAVQHCKWRSRTNQSAYNCSSSCFRTMARITRVGLLDEDGDYTSSSSSSRFPALDTRSVASMLVGIEADVEVPRGLQGNSIFHPQCEIVPRMGRAMARFRASYTFFNILTQEEKDSLYTIARQHRRELHDRVWLPDPKGPEEMGAWGA